MTTKELLEQLKAINQEKVLATFHDDILMQDFPDIDALDKVIILIDYLAKKNPSYKLTVAELLEVAELEP